MAGRYPRKHVNLPAHVVELIDQIMSGKSNVAPEVVESLGNGRDNFCRIAVALLIASLEIEGEGETMLERYHRLIELRKQGRDT